MIPSQTKHRLISNNESQIRIKCNLDAFPSNKRQKGFVPVSDAVQQLCVLLKNPFRPSKVFVLCFIEKMKGLTCGDKLKLITQRFISRVIQRSQFNFADCRTALAHSIRLLT